MERLAHAVFSSGGHAEVIESVALQRGWQESWWQEITVSKKARRDPNQTTLLALTAPAPKISNVPALDLEPRVIIEELDTSSASSMRAPPTVVVHISLCYHYIYIY